MSNSHSSTSDIRSEFEKAFGRRPDVVAQAPGRVNLIGEHIDYSDGFVLPFAIKDVTTVAIGKRADRTLTVASVQRPKDKYLTSLDNLAPLTGEPWSRYVLGVLWAIPNHLQFAGMDILIDGRVPLGAGLSSSAALECSVATALNHLFDLQINLEDLARLTQRAENIYVGVPCGIMDQSISLMGKAGAALLLDCRDLHTEEIPFEIASENLELLIIDSQAHHSLVDGGYAERRASCERAVGQLGIPSLRDISVAELFEQGQSLDELTFKRAKHAVTEMKRVLDAVTALKARDFVTLGRLLNESHASLRDDYTVSCVELDLAVDTAIAEGALGARMVGGGFGGSAIALISADSVDRVKAAISSSFAAKNFKAPRFFTSLPSDGAKVLTEPA
ncbi:MAG: galactokinase [Actinomycetes bacterium]